MPVDQLHASASVADITPNRACWIAGFGQNRLSSGVRHRLTARCLTLRQNGVTVVVVVADVIGLPWRFGQQIRRMLQDVVGADHLILCATHTHSGPDTIGLWGETPKVSGVDPVWMRALAGTIDTLVRDTLRAQQPAEAFACRGEAPRVSVNIRDEKELDRDMSLCLIRTPNGETIASVVNFGCHPEILNNHQLTPDYPHFVRQTVESSLGGVCLFINGALGGMVTPVFDEAASPPGENWDAAAAIGRRLGRAALKRLERADSVGPGGLRTACVRTRIPVDNAVFHALRQSGVLAGGRRDTSHVTTSIAAFRLGSATFFTVPGEPVPAVSRKLLAAIHVGTPFLFSLGNDELGYILTSSQFAERLYGYEQRMSMGPETASRVEHATFRALRKVSAWV